MSPPGDFDPRVGLCSRCTHAKLVQSHNGPRYLLCRLASSDRRFPKYPYTPVFDCAGFKEAPADDA